MRRLAIPAVLAVCFLLLAGGLTLKRQGTVLPAFLAAEEEVKGAVSESEIPIYQPSTLVSRTETESGIQLTLRSTDEADKVRRFYARKEPNAVQIIPGQDETIIIITYSPTSL